jgi:hypothetical protein
MLEPLTAVAITLMRKMTMMITITALIMLICTMMMMMMMMMLFVVVSPLYKIVWHAAGDTT